MGFEFWLLVYNISYLFNQTPAYRPWLNWIGVDLRRLGPEDFVRSFPSIRYQRLLTLRS
jgi:hypothetical protein